MRGRSLRLRCGRCQRDGIPLLSKIIRRNEKRLLGDILARVRCVKCRANPSATMLTNARDLTGWSLLHRKLMPGLGARWLSLCETPDLDIVPQRFPAVRTVRFFGGLELGLLHLGFSACCLPVRAGLIRSLLPAAGWFLKIANLLQNLGTDRGGMLVEVTGIDADGQSVTGQWSLHAEAGDGPNVPILPVLALIRRMLGGQENMRGAIDCAGLLKLDDIEHEFLDSG